MLRITTRRAVAALAVVCLISATSPAFAAGHRLADVAGGGLFERAWSWLAELAGLTFWRGESGGYRDPNGGATTAATPVAPAGAGLTSLRGEAGGFMDPNGGAAPQGAAPTSSLPPSSH